MLSQDHLNAAYGDKSVRTNIPKVNDKHMNFTKGYFHDAVTLSFFMC